MLVWVLGVKVVPVHIGYFLDSGILIKIESRTLLVDDSYQTTKIRPDFQVVLENIG